MSSTITVRNLDPGDKSWLRSKARALGISMEEFVRRLIRQERAKTASHESVSEAFRRYFGPEHGVDLPPRAHWPYRPVEFDEEGNA